MRAVFEQFLLFPLPVLWLLLVALLLPRASRWRPSLLGFALALFAIGCMPATGKLMQQAMLSTTSLVSYTAPANVAMIVVPTGGTFEDPAGRWWPQEGSVHRVVAGLEWQRQLDGVPLVISGGSPFEGQPPEAPTLTEFFPLEQPNIHIEPTGDNTAETARVVAERWPADTMQGSVLLVSSLRHIPRAAAALRHYGYDVLAAPTHAADAAIGLTDFIPSNYGMKRLRAVTWELAGIAMYLATGRIELDDLG